MKNNATVGIVILNYNNYNDTINCINSIEKYNTASIKYIIVDNGSTNPNSVKELDYFCKINLQINMQKSTKIKKQVFCLMSHYLSVQQMMDMQREIIKD